MPTSTTVRHRVERSIDNMVPHALRATGDEERLRHARVTILFSLVLLTASFVWLALGVVLRLWVTLPLLTCGAVLFGLVPLTLRRSVVLAAHQVTATLLVIVLGIAWFRGKQEAPVVAWLVLCPLLATLSGGTRSGYVWVGVVGASLLGLTLFGQADAMRSNIPQVWLARPLVLWTLSLGIQLCASAYEVMRDRMLAQLLQTHAEIERKHRESAQQLQEISLLNQRLATEHKAAQDAAARLEVARAQAEAASQAKGRFLANVSHELRTPMNAVLGTTEWLLDDGLSDAQRAKAETILSAGHSLLAIINNVLDMSKIEADQLQLHAADFDAAKVIESLLGQMRVLANAKKLVLRAELERLPQELLHGDELRLRQVLVNLIGNAIKFTNAGSVTLRVSPVTRTAQSVKLHFSVSDTGIGMNEEALSRIFNPFEQADESTTRRFGGTGLGLSISKRLVALMGGELTVHSAPSQGSTFEFAIDFQLGAVARPPRASRPGTPIVDQLRAWAPYVLVAEDTNINRILLERLLVHLGCRVEMVDDGAKALARLTRDHTFDLVFMDWHMPGLDGVDATAQIRSWELSHQRPRTRIIGFTASALDEEVARCRNAGMDDVLTKPIIRAQLEQKLYETLLASNVDASRSGLRPGG